MRDNICPLEPGGCERQDAGYYNSPLVQSDAVDVFEGRVETSGVIGDARIRRANKQSDDVFATELTLYASAECLNRPA